MYMYMYQSFCTVFCTCIMFFLFYPPTSPHIPPPTHTYMFYLPSSTHPSPSHPHVHTLPMLTPSLSPHTPSPHFTHAHPHYLHTHLHTSPMHTLTTPQPTLRAAHTCRSPTVPSPNPAASPPTLSLPPHTSSLQQQDSRRPVSLGQSRDPAGEENLTGNAGSVHLHSKRPL